MWSWSQSKVIFSSTILCLWMKKTFFLILQVIEKVNCLKIPTPFSQISCFSGRSLLRQTKNTVIIKAIMEFDDLIWFSFLKPLKLIMQIFHNNFHAYIWVKAWVKNGPSKIGGRQPLKNLKWCGLLRQTIALHVFLKSVFRKFYLVHSWILSPICFIYMYTRI